MERKEGSPPSLPPSLKLRWASPLLAVAWRFARAFTLSSLISFSVVYSSLWWINYIASKAPSIAIGTVFATVALTTGSIFFLYSLKYYISLAIVLSFSQSESAENIAQSAKGKRRGILSWILGLAANGNGASYAKASEGKSGPVGLTPNLEHITLKRYPKVSVHVPLYNEKKVVERILNAVTNFEYSGDYEVVIADDSTDETTQIVLNYLKSKVTSNKLQVVENTKEGWILTQGEIREGVVLKHLHRTSRARFKGGALKEALVHTDQNVEFITVFDAYFVPYPDTL